MQTRNKPLSDISNLFASAVGAAKGVGDELKAVTRSQAEKFIADMDLVTREEHDVLKARLDVMQAELDSLKSASKPTRARKAAPKRRTTQSDKKT
ncbi:accessory factor UbiK family protein [uncultured Algimonas sp.]|uniref:accessory factor UbiK family protein n=1 Tax=uncultured Algimonas sp. TaxID=1547920 RepID=UPI002618593A|nr:accessory factor UbiK family protein [uncultured Algimonas sp.]